MEWTAPAYLTNMSEKHKFTPPSAIQVKNWQKAISTEEKLDVISRLKESVQRAAKLSRSGICTISDNADRITENAKSGMKVSV